MNDGLFIELAPGQRVRASAINGLFDVGTAGWTDVCAVGVPHTMRVNKTVEEIVGLMNG